MLIAKIPKDIKEYKEKIIFGLTLRKLLSSIAAGVVCIPLYIFGSRYLGDNLTGWLVIIVASPIVAFGFFKYNGMHFENFIGAYIMYHFVLSRKRRFVMVSFFEEIENEIKKLEKPRGRGGKQYG